MPTDKGLEIARLQRRIHAQRKAIAELKAQLKDRSWEIAPGVWGTSKKASEYRQVKLDNLSLQDQNEKLIASNLRLQKESPTNHLAIALRALAEAGLGVDYEARRLYQLPKASDPRLSQMPCHLCGDPGHSWHQHINRSV